MRGRRPGRSRAPELEDGEEIVASSNHPHHVLWEDDFFFEKEAVRKSASNGGDSDPNGERLASPRPSRFLSSRWLLGLSGRGGALGTNGLKLLTHRRVEPAQHHGLKLCFASETATSLPEKLPDGDGDQINALEAREPADVEATVAGGRSWIGIVKFASLLLGPYGFGIENTFVKTNTPRFFDAKK